MRVCVHVIACVRVPIFSNNYCIGLGYHSGVSRTILGNIMTHAHSIHIPRAMFIFPTRIVT